MLVYRDLSRRASTDALLGELRRDVGRLSACAAPAHEGIRSALIDLGVLESAVADALCAAADDLPPSLWLFREAGSALGRALWHRWHDRLHEAARWSGECARALDRLAGEALPDRITISVPEGYAFYAVYPETYLVAAERWEAAAAPGSLLCVGLRSIGASLSAAVVGTLAGRGRSVRSVTLRPRGHPFDRRVEATPELESSIAAPAVAYAIVVDEGPGISGSSLAGTAAWLAGLGVPDDRIVLMPSWRTDGGGLRSAAARDRWGRHPQELETFERLWLDEGRLGDGCALRDLSAGHWRERAYPDPSCYPAVQPQHERRKYLALPSDGAPPVRLRFVGLGRYGEERARLATDLAHSGLVPRIGKLEDGFLEEEHLPGTPLDASTGVGDDLLDTVASYLAWRHREIAATGTGAGAPLAEMLRVNVRESLGEAWADRLAAAVGEPAVERPVSLDGRMQPHEWLRTSRGWVKTDAFDHADDHFHPGNHDAAWDVAGACIELRLRRPARRRLVERYQALSGDRTLAARLPAHAAAYTAFRLGYASLAADTLGDAPDGRRFAALADRYRARLRRELAHPRSLWTAAR